jgi:hypothetical protein
MYRAFSIVVCFTALACFVAMTRAETPVSLEALGRAPQSVRVDGIDLHLKAQVSRDFMPGWVSDADTEPAARGKPMTATLMITARKGERLPSGIRVDAAWVIFRNQVWRTSAAEEQPRNEDSRQMVVSLSGGPKWEPRSIVDVVVRVVDTNGTGHLLASRHQRIKSSW